MIDAGRSPVSAPACDFFPGGAHIETVRVGCYSAIHVLSAWGAVSSWCRRLLHAICDLFLTPPRPCTSLRLLILSLSPASCVASISAPSVPVSSHRRPRIGDLVSAALGLVSDHRLHSSCRQLHRTCQRINSASYIDSYRGGHQGLLGPWLHYPRELLRQPSSTVSCRGLCEIGVDGRMCRLGFGLPNHCSTRIKRLSVDFGCCPCRRLPFGWLCIRSLAR